MAVGHEAAAHLHWELLSSSNTHNTTPTPTPPPQIPGAFTLLFWILSLVVQKIVELKCYWSSSSKDFSNLTFWERGKLVMEMRSFLPKKRQQQKTTTVAGKQVSCGKKQRNIPNFHSFYHFIFCTFENTTFTSSKLSMPFSFFKKFPLNKIQGQSY